MKMNAYAEPSSTAEIRRCTTQPVEQSVRRSNHRATVFKTGSSTAMGAASEISPVRRVSRSRTGFFGPDSGYINSAANTAYARARAAVKGRYQRQSRPDLLELNPFLLDSGCGT